MKQQKILFLCYQFSLSAAFLAIPAMRQRNNVKLFGETKLTSASTTENTLEPAATTTSGSSVVVKDFMRAYCQKNVSTLLSLMNDEAVWDDFAFSYVCNNKPQIERRLRLQFDTFPPSNYDTLSSLVLVDSGNTTNSRDSKVAVLFQDPFCGRRGAAWFWLGRATSSAAQSPKQSVGYKISRVEWLLEPAKKSGEAGLKVLSTVSKLFNILPLSRQSSSFKRKMSDLTAPERYFAAWNRRDMDAAVNVFTDNATYDDTAFPEPFAGTQKIKEHLFKCQDCFPDSFSFEIDDLIHDNSINKMAVQWHVENAGQQMPYTRGRSFYAIADGLINDGVDFVEPSGPLKPGTGLFVTAMRRKFAQEPVRFIPVIVWLAYMYIVFVSDNILPGANALQLEARTWQEVKDLSLNFFLVAPLLKLPFSPIVHPILEGVFNLLLSWAALFAGFFSDDRPSKPSWLPMLPMVIGMQFLTSAFLLPYLAIRTSEKESTAPITTNELGNVARICESPAIGALLGSVGTGAIVWAIFGRMNEFGAWNDRYNSFLDLMSIDRVGCSFLVDLALFALFQAWLINDDVKRRGENNIILIAVAKYVPFFGLAAYLIFRKSLTNDIITAKKHEIH